MYFNNQNMYGYSFLKNTIVQNTNLKRPPVECFCYFPTNPLKLYIQVVFILFTASKELICLEFKSKRSSNTYLNKITSTHQHILLQKGNLNDCGN